METWQNKVKNGINDHFKGIFAALDECGNLIISNGNAEILFNAAGDVIGASSIEPAFD